MSDDLRRMLAEASRAAQPHLRPPGPDAARNTLRRRRVMRVSGLAMVLVLALVLATNLLPRPTSPMPPLVPTPSIGPTVDPSASPSGPVSATPTVVPSLSPSATPAPGSSPSPGATPSGRPGSSGQPVANPSPSPSPSPSPPPPACVDIVEPQITNATTPAPATMTFSIAPADLERLCDGWQIRITWAAYYVYQDSSQMMASANDFVLSAATPTRTGRLYSEYNCPADRYFYFGAHTFPETIPAGEHLDLPAWSPGRSTGLFRQHFLNVNC
ncbi:hypothetical protein [Catellatospora vulcania]|uniref:hypothetical protein n=1 Tax=Catellatospora vulcania TaxID=1460450 RepID=UPI0012D48DAA|nr:hypothetical protein [Catellatospora vulcania]